MGTLLAAAMERDPLPVDEVLDDLGAALDASGAAVLEAPPGAGKTTRVPLALLADQPAGRIVVLEPRRVAARAAAARLAAQLDEKVGRRVGLTTRDERRVSAATRVEVITEGVLLRRLQRDPTLPGTALVILDEFHERNLEADLALAFALDVRAALREDLRLLVASATLDGARVATLLGDVPVVRAKGRRFPVEVTHRDRPGRSALSTAVCEAVIELCAEGPGDVLVFLPGVAEIRRAASELAERSVTGDPVVRPLYGALPANEQDAAIAPDPGGRRRVVLATDLAESSLTVAGVTAVVDAGLSREPRFDAATGMTGLVTVPASRASAEQRAGRAGRLAPGRAVRLWPQREHAMRDAHPRPALHTDDLTGAVLEVAAWGAQVDELALLDPPPDAGWSRATDTLRELGAIGPAGRITRHGRRLADLPVHPRIGQMLVLGAERGLGPLAVELAAVLADRDPLRSSPEAPDADLATRVRWLRGDQLPISIRPRAGSRERARRERRRLARLLDAGSERPDLERLGELVLLGWPDRLAIRRDGRRGSYVLVGGRGAELPEADPLAGERLLAVAHLDRGRDAARIHLAAAVDESSVRELAADRLREERDVVWRDGDVVAERREAIGAVVLTRRRDPDPDPARRSAALLEGVMTDGLDLFDRRDADRQLAARVGLLRRTFGEVWPDLSDDAVLADAERIVAPFLLGLRRRAELASLRLGDVLRSQLTPAQLPELDRLAPTHLVVPSGSRIRLDYLAGDRPVLAVKLQELFGATSTPRVAAARVPVLVHLLSPAGRPVQVTDDLAGFWQRGYREVRAELRGRYPKHPWPQDPTTATPTARTRRS